MNKTKKKLKKEKKTIWIIGLDELCKKEMKEFWEGYEWSKKDLHELSYDLSIEEIDKLLHKLLERIL